jgi:hypothetical protein
MRNVLPEKIEGGRIEGETSWGCYGAFRIQGPCGEALTIVASGADYPESEGWEHVSVSTRRRCPNWQEMCFVKDLFWDAETLVVQFHPPKSEWVNNHSFCLHLWSKGGFPRPPAILVGVKSMGTLK